MARKKKATEFVTKTEFKRLAKTVRLEMVQLGGLVEDVRGDLRDMKRRCVVWRVKARKRGKR